MGLTLSDVFPSLRSDRKIPPLPRRRPDQRCGKRRPAAARASSIGLESLEPRVLLSADVLPGVSVATYLANPTLGTGVYTELQDALALVDNIALDIDSTGDWADAMATAIPGLLEREGLNPDAYKPPTLGEVLANDSAANLNALGNHVRNLLDDAVQTVFASAFAGELDALQADVGSIHIEVNVLDADPATPGTQTFLLKPLGGDNYEYLYNIEVVVELTDDDAKDTFSLDPGRNADALELDYGAATPFTVLPQIPLTSQYRFNSILGVGATIVEDTWDHDNDEDTPEQVRTTITPTDGFLRNPGFSAGVSADVTTPAFTALQFGFLDISAGQGTAEFDLHLAAEFSGDFSSAGAITSATPTIGTGGLIDVVLPVVISPDDVLTGNGFDGALPQIKLTTTDPFADVHDPVPGSGDQRTAITVDLVGFDSLNPFRNLDAAGLANVFSGLSNLLAELQNKAQLFGLKLPLLDATKVSDLMGFDGPMQVLYEKLTKVVNGVRVADFTTVQQFVGKLQAALNQILADYNASPDFDDIGALVAINPRYELIANTPTLLFTVELHAAPTGDPIDLAGNLGLPLAPLGDVAVTGDMTLKSAFSVQLTLGIELVEPVDVGVVTAAGPSALIGAVVDGNVLSPVRFNLVLGNVGTVQLNFAAGDYGSTAGLASALQTAINAAIATAKANGTLKPAAEFDDPPPSVNVSANAQGRLVMSSDTLPYLQVIDRGTPVGALVGELGFKDAQRGSTSRLPVDGRLSGDASFQLTFGGTAHTINLAKATTDNNGSVADLVGDLNFVIGQAFGAGTYVELVGNDVVGLRLKFSRGDDFVRIDSSNAVARAELGVQDESLSAPLVIRGDASMLYEATEQGNALPASGNLADPLTFTVTLTQGADSSGAIAVSATLADNNVDPTTGLPTLSAAQAAIKAAQDINEAFSKTTLTGSQKLSSVLIATPIEFRDNDGNGNGKWGIRLIQPAAPLDTTLAFAFADSITIAGISAQEKIGLKDGTANRVGPSLTSTLSGNTEFTINLSGAGGVVTQQKITLNPGAITNTLAGVVDAINTAIAGGSMNGKVVAGLDGTRLVFAVTQPAFRVIELSHVNAAAINDLGLEEGISARTFEGVQAFIQDVHLDASLALEGSASGKANFGFVSLDLGTADVALEASVDADFGTTDKIYVKNLFNAFSKPFGDADGLLGVLQETGAADKLVGFGPAENEEIDIRGSATLEWNGASISVAGTGGVASDLAGELGEVVSPYIHVSLPDITHLNTLTFDADLGSLADLADFSFDDAIAALRAIAQWLQAYVQKLDIVNKELPLLGISLADTLAFASDFAKSVEDIAANPTKSLQALLDKVNEGLQRFAGPLAHVGYQANSPGVLTFKLEFNRSFSDILPIELDMVELLADEGITVPGLKLAGNANLAAAFGFDASLVFGVNVQALSSLLDQTVFDPASIGNHVFLVVDDNDAFGIDGHTKLDMTAFAAADNVTFTGALGPLGLFVTNGGAVLNSDGVFGNTAPASINISLPDLGADDGVITLSDFFAPGNAAAIFNPNNVAVNLGVAAVLPVSFPTASNFIGNLDFTAQVTNPFSADGISYSLNSIPDFSQIDLSSLSLLDTINLFLAGADVVLGSLGDLITGKVFGAEDMAQLPLVGNALADAGAFIDQIRNEVIPAITNLIETAPELAADIFRQVGQILQDAISSLGFLDSAIKLDFFDASGSSVGDFVFSPGADFSGLADKVFSADGFAFVIDLGVDLQLQPADVDLNLEVFQLQITNPITVGIAADLTFGIGVSLTDGFFFQVNPEGEADLSGSITVDLPQDLTAQLFFLQLEAVNNNFGGPGHDLAAAFAVDVVGTGSTGRLGFGDIGNLDFDVDFGAEVDLDFLLKLGVANTGYIGLPKILADFEFAWGFGDVTVNGQQIGIDGDHPELPELALGNIRLDIGSFLGDTIGPFITDIYEVIAPIDPILDILTNPIPVLSDLLGPTSLLDVAATFGIVNPALVTALELLDQLVDFAATVANASEGSEGYVTLLGDTLRFGGNSGLDLTDLGQVGGLTDPSKLLTKALTDIQSAFGVTVPQEVTDALNFIASGIDFSALTGKVGGPSGGFSFPFLDHPEEVLGLFFGRNMTLVAYDLPPLEFGFDFSIYVPIWDGLGARFAGGINALIDLAFGYDTEGIFRFINSGFNPLDLVQGFFVYDDNPFGGFAGIDVPEVLITGKITAAAELNLVVASAGVGGGIFATIGFDLADPDGDFRVRLDEILANLWNGFEQGVGPLGLFDVDALIEAKLFAYIEALFGIWRKEFQFGPSIPLYEAHYQVPHDPVLATDLENGTLRLNIGEFAGDRIYTQPNSSDKPTDGAENLEIEIVDQHTIRVRGTGNDFNVGDWQEYTSKHAGGFTRIIGTGGQEDDSIRIVNDLTTGLVRAEFDGGAGNDTLEGGKAADLLVGGTGEDHLIGGDGNDTLEGGAGADWIEGGDGNDTAHGGEGDDVMIGGAGNDVMFGDAGNDILSGGDGVDTLFGGTGADLIAGGAGADVLQGGDGNDRIWGDLDFQFTGKVLNLAAGTDEPDFLVPADADQGIDYIAGGAGSDEVQGNGGNDFIWGDSSFKLSETNQLQFGPDGLPLLLLPGFGSAGHDNLSGGAGDDTIFGEGGNDVIRGDNLRVDTENDGDPFTWAEGDKFSEGTPHGGVDGDDKLYGGSGSDIIYGNGGDDDVGGGTDNDILFGNAGDDTLLGDVGADVIFGDNGIVELWLAGDALPAGGTYAASTQDFKRLESYSDAGDGDDWIDAGQDNDIVFGGGGLGNQTAEGSIGQTIEDLIKNGSGDDIAFGDHGKVLFDYVAAAGAAFVVRVESVDKDFGGDDQIFGSTGRDVLIGGKGGDFVNGDDAFNPDDPDSRDVVAGDHVLMTQTIKLVKDNPGKVADVYVAFPDRIVSNEDDPTQGGDDTLDGRQDDDYLIGGPGDDRGTGGLGNDVLLGDRGEIVFDLSFIDATDVDYVYDKSSSFVLKTVRSIDLALADIPFTGVDRLSGGDGNDVVIGGGRGDFLYGDAELDGTVGTLSADSDILIGDNGQVDYLQRGTLAKVYTTDTLDATGGDDFIEGNSGVDIALGGVGGDDIWGDAGTPGATDGDDILLGDNGLVDFSQDRDLALELTLPAVQNLATLDLIVSYTDGRGGIDRIRGNAGSDIAMGGTAGDIIHGDDEAGGAGATDLGDILLGDNGIVLLVNPALDANALDGADRRVVRGGAIALVRSTDEDDAADNTGGIDTISGNAGADIILGGVRGDTLYGDRQLVTVASNALDGADIILGDNGALEWLSTGRFDEITGIDIEATNSHLYAHFAQRDANLDTLDLITTEQPNNGGRDLIFGDNGGDVILGGTDADDLHGDSGDADAILSTSGNDLMFGDHGRLYPQFSRALLGQNLVNLVGINGRNFFAIDIDAGDGGEGDRMWGEEGDDLMLGQQGDDRMWGGSGDDDMTGGHNVAGGADELGNLGAIRISIEGDAFNDAMDGGSGDDALAGDNTTIWRRGDTLSPRFRVLDQATIYTTTYDTVTPNVAGFGDGGAAALADSIHWRPALGTVVGRDITLRDHSDAVQADPQFRFGRDAMAGGADDDTMFGQLGNDLMQGDGSIATVANVSLHAVMVDDTADLTDETLQFNVPEAATDGDDYMEGNGGNDLMFGGLGQDDMVGGSSNLFGLATPDQRPDGSDIMFGGAATRTDRNGGYDGTEDGGDGSAVLPELNRARDADVMLGDNANVFRLLNGSNAALRFAYDTAAYSNGILVRAMHWLDYTLGGPDYDPDAQAGDRGAGDWMHGESGNDLMHGMAGSDVMFGGAHDDDLTGGYGHDWMSGGTGQDGLIGDDGLLRTSRNGMAETLYGIAATTQTTISTPGNIQTAVINVTSQLAKSADLTPISVDPDWIATDDEYGYGAGEGPLPFADDIMYGGVGGDWLHGGSGDDAISGAEALTVFHDAALATKPQFFGAQPPGAPSLGTTGGSSINPGNVLRFNATDEDGSMPHRIRAGEFALYDEYDPLRQIRVDSADGWSGQLVKDGTGTHFILNFDEDEGVARPGGNIGKPTGQQQETYGPVFDDGDDKIFGDAGNDWLVGGTGRDNLWGGWGNDLLNADDDHTTHGNLNDEPDTHPTYEDRAYGGAGRDVLIANTGGDRLIDWVGEWNSYLVPFAPFGMATVSRTLQPQLPEFLYALSRADGADPTIVADGNGSALRNGEPHGELGLVLQKDAAWQDQTGAPADPQAGNIPGGQRDVLRSADFNGPQSQSLVPESGTWSISGGKYVVAPDSSASSKDAISLFYVDDYLPAYFEIAATINALKPVGGFKANAYVVFDYVSPTDFKFAGVNASTNKIEIGQRTAAGWTVLKQGVFTTSLKSGVDYNVLLAVNGSAVTLVVDNKVSVSHTFAPRVDAEGVTHDLRFGMVGLGADNGKASIDNLRVQIIPPKITLTAFDGFASAPTLLNLPASGWTWQAATGRLDAAPAAGAFTLATNDVAVGAYSMLRIDTVVAGQSLAGIAFDVYSADDFKWAAVSKATNQVLIGHYTVRAGWVVDAAVSRAIPAGDVALTVTLKGSTVSVMVNGQAALSRSYNASVVDGGTGLLARGGAASFDSFQLQSDDPRFAAPETTQTQSSATTTDTSRMTSTLLTSQGWSVPTLDAQALTAPQLAAATLEDEAAPTSASLAQPVDQTSVSTVDAAAATSDDDVLALSAPLDDGAVASDDTLRVASRGGSEQTTEAASEPLIDWTVQLDADTLAADTDESGLWQEDFVVRLGRRSSSPVNAALTFTL